MFAEVAAKASFIHSPIGPIPGDYPRLALLCRAAHLRYRDEKIDDKGTVFRTWSVVADAQPATDKSGRRTGSASRGFRKFCMLLDLLEHQNPQEKRVAILDRAINPEPSHRRLLAMSWQLMNDELAKMGLDGYDVLRAKKSHGDRELPEW